MEHSQAPILPLSTEAMLYTPEQCYLSIRLQADGFSFFIFSSTNGALVHSEFCAITSKGDFVEQFKDHVYEKQILLGDFRGCWVSVADRRTMQYPLFLSIGRKKELFELLYGATREELFDDSVRSMNLGITFPFSQSLYDFMKRTFLFSRFSNVDALVMDSFTPLVTESLRKQIFVVIEGKQLSIYQYDRGMLHNMIKYTYSNVADILYYVLLQWQNAQMSQVEDELYVWGSWPEKEEFMTQANKYLKNIRDLRAEDLGLISTEGATALPLDYLCQVNELLKK